jgi:hypothetical protein
MSRAGYDDGCEDWWQHIRWRGAVTSAFRGKRGQAFLRETLAALDALPHQRLIREELTDGMGEVCAIGAVGLARGVDMSEMDSYDHGSVAGAFGISSTMTREIFYENDEWRSETPEQRFQRMRRWVSDQIKSTP